MNKRFKKGMIALTAASLLGFNGCLYGSQPLETLYGPPPDHDEINEDYSEEIKNENSKDDSDTDFSEKDEESISDQVTKKKKKKNRHSFWSGGLIYIKNYIYH